MNSYRLLLPKDFPLHIINTTALVTDFKFSFFLSQALTHYYNCKVASSLLLTPINSPATRSPQCYTPNTVFKAFKLGGQDWRDGAKRRGGHSSTHPSDVPILLTMLLPQTASLNHFFKPKIKTQPQLSPREKGKKITFTNKA